MGRRLLFLVKTALKTNHNRIISCGVLVLLFFLLTWLSILWRTTLAGLATPILNFGFLYLGLDIFWQKRKILAKESVTDEERILGYLLILGSAACFPFFLESASLQAALCIMIVLGIAICNWGIAILQKNPLALALVLFAIYPDLAFLGLTVRNALTGDQLERVMAWLASIAFSVIGQPVSVQGPLLSLSQNLDPQKAVEVASGCSGFDMAFPIAGFAFMMGLYLKQTWQKTALLMVIGIVLALIFNIPRIMLLAYAVVYWGKSSFEFWHGPIGGQIFAGTLFTIYYYAAMAIIDRKPKQAKS